MSPMSRTGTVEGLCVNFVMAAFPAVPYIVLMTDAILDFPGTSPPQGNSPGYSRTLVQLKLDPAFVQAIDNWRGERGNWRAGRPLPRTVTIIELASIGLADRALRAAKRRRQP
jgi:hypothetical protein